MRNYGIVRLCVPMCVCLRAKKWKTTGHQWYKQNCFCNTVHNYKSTAMKTIYQTRMFSIVFWARSMKMLQWTRLFDTRAAMARSRIRDTSERENIDVTWYQTCYDEFRQWPLTLTTDLERAIRRRYFDLTPLRERCQRNRRCEGESMSLRQGMSHAVNDISAKVDGSAQILCSLLVL